IILGIAMLAERLAAFAGEREARRGHEDGGKKGERNTPLGEKSLPTNAPPRSSPPSPDRARPWRGRNDAGPIPRRRECRNPPSRTRNRDPSPTRISVQGGDEHGALHREFEGAVLQQIAQNVGAAEPFPYLAEQQWPADAFC